jgi:hypothetical protein
VGCRLSGATMRDTLATESFARLDARAVTRTFPGGSPHLWLLRCRSDWHSSRRIGPPTRDACTLDLTDERGSSTRASNRASKGRADAFPDMLMKGDQTFQPIRRALWFAAECLRSIGPLLGRKLSGR